MDYKSYLKIWEVFWTVLRDGFAMHAGRKECMWGGGVCIVWGHLYKLLYFVCECIKVQSPQCCANNWPAEVAQLTEGIACWCVSVCWMHCAQVTCADPLPWNHVTGSRVKFLSFILSALTWGLRSLLPAFLLHDMNLVFYSWAKIALHSAWMRNL